MRGIFVVWSCHRETPYAQVLSPSYLATVFLFSSRRRHTSFDCDWSSDVCSSDLDSAPQPVGRPGGVDGVIGVLPFLGKTVEEIGHMVPYPIVPARRDARVRGQDPFKHTPPVPTIGSQPVDGPSRYDLDRGASFVEQRRILDRALSTADHDRSEEHTSELQSQSNLV